MSIWGKIVGGAAGMAMGGPLGAIIGAAAGHAVDKLTAKAVSAAAGDGDDNTRKIAFTIAVIVLGAKMAKADGVVTSDEVNAFKEMFRVPPAEQANVQRIFNLARRDHRGFEPYARQIAGMFRDRPAVLGDLLLCLFHIAKADGEVHESEVAFLHDVARIFGLSEAEFARIRAAEVGPDVADPYEILGVDRDAADDEVKAIYRRLIRENHPDRLIAAGMPQEFIDIANEKMATITTAYDRIRRERRPT